jgi:hypothetical protein
MVVVELLIILLNCDVGEGPAVSNFTIFPICSSTIHALVESTISVDDCEKDATRLAVAGVIISNAVN